MDEVVRKLIVYPDPEFIKVTKALRASDDAIADAASIIWLRVLDPEIAPPDDLPAAAAKLAKVMWA
jgi:TetR/AcrR family transcriptional regulator, transcriptional repressor for nem operon